jgi:hypothetical protein
MTNDEFNDLIARLRNSSTPAHLREETIMVLKQQRQMLEDIYLGARHGLRSTPEHLAGVALGKDGYGGMGDAGF